MEKKLSENCIIPLIHRSHIYMQTHNTSKLISAEIKFGYCLNISINTINKLTPLQIYIYHIFYTIMTLVSYRLTDLAHQV